MNVGGAVSLELRSPDGTVANVPLDADGSYRYDLPAARQDDLFARPGELVAVDDELAELPPLQTVIPGEGTAPVRLKAVVTEIGLGLVALVTPAMRVPVTTIS